MSIMNVLWVIWAGVTTILLALLAYRGTITRYEEDQMFLDPATGHQQQEQNQILARIKQITPYVRVMTGAACVLSATLIGIYVWDAIRQFQ